MKLCVGPGIQQCFAVVLVVGGVSHDLVSDLLIDLITSSVVTGVKLLREKLFK